MINIDKKIYEQLSSHLSPSDIDSLKALNKAEKPTFVFEKTNLRHDELLDILVECSGLEPLAKFELAENPHKIIPTKLIIEYNILPIKSKNEGEIVLITPWVPSDDEISWIKALSGKTPTYKLGRYQDVFDVISQSFGVGASSFDADSSDEFSNLDDADIEEDENATIIKFVNEIVSRALKDRATDIHIEPQKQTLNIRYRIDGNLVPVKLPENLLKFKDAIISRIKIMARLNISEKRRPQDGRINFVSKTGNDIDIRISSLPTLYGESISMRLLTQKSQPITIKDLGFTPEDMARVKIPLSKPHGILLVTGPTGSGKSTTLTAFIRQLRTPQVRIITVEDPVEYEVEGVNQTQIQSEIGLTFSAVLRSVLRQDPDIIMVGEIRDRETADIAIRASLTGHLVLSTLHTNDAAGALTRLVDMDIEPFLIASSVEMILAQRLVRRLCSCKKKANYSKEDLNSFAKALNLDSSFLENCENMSKPVGCNICKNLGYHSRLGIFEILLVNEDLHSLIINRKSAREIRNVARANGMRTLQESGFELVKHELTGMDEIMAYAHCDE